MAHTLCNDENVVVQEKAFEPFKNRNNSLKVYQASAPGSLMLFGEHAVLQGKRALVVAIDQRIRATLIPRQDTVIRLKSDLGKFETTLDEIPKFSVGKPFGKSPFHFVLTALSIFRETLNRGFDLELEADFSSTMGLGSSAAVVVATLRVVSRFVVADKKSSSTPLSSEEEKNLLEPLLLFKQALSVIEAVQGQGSGSDVAASVFGGIILYRKDPLLITSLSHSVSELPPLVAAYVGYKTPTIDVIRAVNQRFKDSQYLLECLFDAMEACTETAVLAFPEKDWESLGHCMNVGHGLLNALGVSDAAIEKTIHGLREQSGILGAKISGAGLGDCVIGVGRCPSDNLLKIEPCLRGVLDV